MAPEFSRDAAEAQSASAAERQEIVTGRLSVVTVDPIDAGRRAADVVAGAGGRIDTRTEAPEVEEMPANSFLTARIPAELLDETIERIRDLGDVTSLSITRDDVTMQSADLDARISALDASVERLRALIVEATSTSDLIEAETALSSRQGELDALVSQRNYLRDQVELSTLTIEFTTDDEDASSGPADFWDAIASGWHSLTAVVVGAVLLFGAALPWLVVLAIPVVIILSVRRIRRRRSS